MKLEVTRDVVADLWPLYESGEASMDTRALVDAFLSEDPPFASKLAESQQEPRLNVMPAVRLSPDAERRLLDDARERAQTKMVLVGVAVAVAGFVLLAIIVSVAFLVAPPSR
jgi:anti-sigma factor RsiW